MMINIKDIPTLLIADDQPDNLRAIIDILQNSEDQYNFITVPNGKVLVDIACKKMPDLIITDWEMPQLNGLEAIAELKKYPETQDIPVIMCTGIKINPQDLKTALEVGALDYVRKPVEATELIARVKSMLKLSASYLKIKEQKEEIQNQAEQLESLNQLKDKLFSIIAHDLRSPLNTLKGMLTILELDALSPEEFKEIGKDVKKRIENIDASLNNLLLWAESQMKGEISYQETIEIYPIINGKIDLFESNASAKQITIINETQPGLTVFADLNHFRAILRNLIGNALKFTTLGGKIVISTKRLKTKVQILIQDTGVGMSEAQIAKLFKRETHFTTQGTSQEKGTGLGLLLCKEFVEKNAGEIWVESQLGIGSTFFVELPIAYVE
ncbi:MAG: response regulator [Microscillaceae bacterium]|jgi:two-component system sensor histidine kinase/response regulator|nr:response regulator [Microscillaceae bacterium]